VFINRNKLFIYISLKINIYKEINSIDNMVRTPKPNKHENNTNNTTTTNTATINNTINKAIRKLVWHYWIGQERGIAKCWCCNVTDISPFEFECGHVQARSKGGLDTVENLRPICGLCNRSMGNKNLIEFQKIHGLPKRTSYLTTMWSYIKSFVGF
jgi:hypothetical protein